MQRNLQKARSQIVSMTIFPSNQSLNSLRLLAAQNDLYGLNVTIPYKQQVLNYLNEKNDVVQKTGACNCIKIVDHKLYGFNTDVIGFEQSLLEYFKPHHTHALILGTGGAAKAVEYVLRKLNVSFLYVSRNADRGRGVISYEEINDDILTAHTLIVNTTPLGMYPETHTYPPINYESLTSKHYLFDLVYNPSMTVFLEKGKQKGAAIKNGYDMLVLQAEESWRIWNESA